jgi:hypothetical protein
MTWASLGSFLSQPLCIASQVRASATEEMRRTRSGFVSYYHERLAMSQQGPCMLYGNGSRGE